MIDPPVCEGSVGIECKSAKFVGRGAGKFGRVGWVAKIGSVGWLDKIVETGWVAKIVETGDLTKLASGRSGRDNQSATLFSRPGMCLILKSKDWRRARHRHTIGDKLASIHWRLRWSVSTRNCLPRRYQENRVGFTLVGVPFLSRLRKSLGTESNGLVGDSAVLSSMNLEQNGTNCVLTGVATNDPR